MLFAFIELNREEIISRTRQRVRGRAWPSVSAREIEFGVPLFLTQLSETLRLEATATPYSSEIIGSTAARHGAELLAAGFSVNQVVHDYGDICQAITEIAAAQSAPISVEEFHTLNRCLDTAIAEAVTEHTRLTAERRSSEELERLGQAAHELRDELNTAMLAFHTLKRGTVGIGGSTGAVLGRSLASLRALVDGTLSEVRLAAGKQQRERIAVTAFLDEMAAAGMLHAEYRQIRFTVEPLVDHTLAVDGDPQLLGSAVMNLLSNAFKYTHPGGTVTLKANAVGERLVVEVADECGGIPPSAGDLFQPFGERRGRDRSGLGLGLSMARQAVRAHDGDIRVRNLPGQGCVFAIDVPLSLESIGSPASA
jgi:signal transduction histidine kinase